MIAASPPVIPHYAPGSPCEVNNGTFCTDWVREHWHDTLEPALVQHIEQAVTWRQRHIDEEARREALQAARAVAAATLAAKAPAAVTPQQNGYSASGKLIDPATGFAVDSREQRFTLLVAEYGFERTCEEWLQYPSNGPVPEACMPKEKA